MYTPILPSFINNSDFVSLDEFRTIIENTYKIYEEKNKCQDVYAHAGLATRLQDAVRDLQNLRCKRAIEQDFENIQIILQLSSTYVDDTIKSLKNHHKKYIRSFGGAA